MKLKAAPVETIAEVEDCSIEEERALLINHHYQGIQDAPDDDLDRVAKWDRIVMELEVVGHPAATTADDPHPEIGSQVGPDFDEFG